MRYPLIKTLTKNFNVKKVCDLDLKDSEGEEMVQHKSLNPVTNIRPSINKVHLKLQKI